MDYTQVNQQIELFSFKNKLLILLNSFLYSSPQMDFTCFKEILCLLDKKYNDYHSGNDKWIKSLNEAIKNGIISISISTISTNIMGCNNELLLKDLLNSIDTRINYS
jgi:hypothetical protein